MKKSCIMQRWSVVSLLILCGWLPSGKVLAQGVLPVQAEGGGYVVLPAGGQAELVEPDANGQLQPAAGAVTTKVPLTDLLRRIRSLLPAGAR